MAATTAPRRRPIRRKTSKKNKASQQGSSAVSNEAIKVAQAVFAAPRDPGADLDIQNDRPNRINPAAERIWREVLQVYGERINKEGNEEAGGPDFPGVSPFILKAAIALTIFASACRDEGIDPFSSEVTTQDPSSPAPEPEPEPEIEEVEEIEEDEAPVSETPADLDLDEWEEMLVGWIESDGGPKTVKQVVDTLNQTSEEAWSNLEVVNMLKDLLERGIIEGTVERKGKFLGKAVVDVRMKGAAPPAPVVEDEDADPVGTSESGRWYDDDYADLDLEEREVDEEALLRDPYFMLDDDDFSVGVDPESLEDENVKDPHWKTEDPGEESEEWFAPKGVEYPEEEEFEDEHAATYAYLRWYLSGSDGVRKARNSVLKSVRSVLKNQRVQFVNEQGRLNRMDAPEIRQDRVRFIPGGYDPLAEGNMEPAYKIRLYQVLNEKAGPRAGQVAITEDEVRKLVQSLKGGASGGQWRYPYINERNQKKYDSIKFVPTDLEGNEHVKLDLFLQFFPEESEDGEDTGRFNLSLYYAFLIEEDDAAALVGFPPDVGTFADGDNKPNLQVMQALSKYALKWSRLGYPPPSEDMSEMFKPKRRGPRAAKRRVRASVEPKASGKKFKLGKLATEKAGKKFSLS